ncbi:Uncharacterised protein [Mycobacterium tuberculosis]|uniref:Uncharacterized protein n=1 Tax=Mycobacterium tuberculosis TaxID=1773 RepID=A0A654TV33_MYCTX|nr:Uncharacterised protein [Mycobacterium tuberculosis]
MRTVDSRVRSSSLAIQAERICARGSTALIRFRILAKLLSDKRSRAVSKRRRLAHCGSILRPRRSWNAQVTRRRTAVSASASVVTWKWSTTSLALGSSPGVRIAEA